MTMLVSDESIYSTGQLRKGNYWFQQFEIDSHCICVNTGKNLKESAAGTVVFTWWLILALCLTSL